VVAPAPQARSEVASPRSLLKERSFSLRAKEKEEKAEPVSPKKDAGGPRGLSKSASSVTKGSVQHPARQRFTRLKTVGDLPEADHGTIVQLKRFLAANTDFAARVEELLSNYAFFALVLEFAQQRYASEVVLFWKELNRIRKGQDNAMSIQDFFQTFLFDQGSEVAVTVPHGVLVACRTALESPRPLVPKQLLDEAWQMIQSVLEDFWPLYTGGDERSS
jgi:hypothetical protein